MTSIRRKLFFLLAALLALPMQAQVNLVYVDSARVARLLAEDAGLVAAPVVEVADTDTVPLADRPVVADGADFDRLWTDSFANRMAAIIEDPLLQSTQMAVMVWDLSADQCVYRFNEAQRMRPASVQKCVTAITALDRLGVDYQFSTRLYCRGDIDSTGVLHGSLYCVGGMDPLFGDANMRAFVRALREKGIRRITGDLLADKSMKDDKPMGEGWCWDDDDSNPPLSPLLYNRRDRFMAELSSRLRAAGIVLEGTLGDATLPAGSTLLAEETHDLTRVLQRMMKKSDNLHAESVFYQLAKSTGVRRAGARQGRQVINQVVRAAGLDPAQYYAADGCGLSLYNYVTADLLVHLLRLNYHNTEAYEALLPALPIAGRDGTLRKRLRGTAADSNVRAKTGTVTSVKTLAGFCTASNGHRLAFCILNQGTIRASQANGLQDRICRAMCE